MLSVSAWQRGAQSSGNTGLPLFARWWLVSSVFKFLSASQKQAEREMLCSLNQPFVKKNFNLEDTCERKTWNLYRDG